MSRLIAGDIVICNNENDGHFTIGKTYEILEGGYDCYSNMELVVRNDINKDYFIYGYTFNQAFKEIK